MTGRSRAGSAVDRVRQAVALLRTGKVAEAESICRAVLGANPAQPDALHFLGLIEQHRGNTLAAAQLLRRATDAAPGYADAWNNLGNLLKLLGDLDGAETAYQRVIAIQPGHANALSNLGPVLRARGDLAAAEAACREAIRIDPRHVAAHNNLGNVLHDQGRLDEAAASYRASIAFDPLHPEGPKLLGLALAAAGRMDEAQQVYRDWLARVPGQPVATHLLAAHSGENVPSRASDGYVKSLFDAMANGFDHHLSTLEYRAPEIVAAAVAREGPDGAAWSVLDAGCGTGLCARFLRPGAARLVGVDLSAGMLRRAALLALYDELIEEELTAHLRARPSAYDLIVSADTLCYFGALDEVLPAAAAALRPGGRLIFTVERAAGDAGPGGYRLAAHGRYSHAEGYVREALARAGFAAVAIDEAILRTERGAPVAGLVATAHLGCAFDTRSDLPPQP
ncbi:MAG TPA: tetratricopeptide repeat protein [Candidatus Binatia bacterium]|nr:tetratricopeptide repeat protein [Candidatus Binatia bacterium]